MFLVYYRWSRPLLLFLSTITIVIVYTMVEMNAARLVIFLLLLLILYNLVIETWVALAFISPGKRKKEFISKGWVSQFHKFDTTIHSMSYFDNKVRPLVIIIHGWRSCASSMQGRAENYIELGFHVIIFELLGHGKSEFVSKWTAGHASTTFNDFFDNLENHFDMDTVGDIYLHGHSMGGFVLLRFDSLISSSDSGIKGYILESPMTCYSMIFEESLQTLKIPKFAENVFWRRLSSHFNKINPRISDVSELIDVDTPNWGLIRNNCIVIQAEYDDRLGLEHYHRLIKHQEKIPNFIFEHHLVDDLTHAGARENINRNILIKQWLTKVNIHSDSE